MSDVAMHIVTTQRRYPRQSPRPMRRSPQEASPPYLSPAPTSGRRLPPRQLIIPATEDDTHIASETDNVKVFVRTRPINQREVEMGERLLDSHIL